MFSGVDKTMLIAVFALIVLFLAGTISGTVNRAITLGVIFGAVAMALVYFIATEV